MKTLNELGFTIIEDFITIEEELMLMQHIKPSPVRSTLARNSIQRFGSSVPYKGNIISKEIPNHFIFLIDRLMERNLLPVRPDSVSINEYLPNQSISPHIDSQSSGEIISVLSLLSPATMVFSKGKEQMECNLLPRGLSQMKGVIRKEWMHSIKPVKDKRYSIVFRCGTA